MWVSSRVVTLSPWPSWAWPVATRWLTRALGPFEAGLAEPAAGLGLEEAAVLGLGEPVELDGDGRELGRGPGRGVGRGVFWAAGGEEKRGGGGEKGAGEGGGDHFSEWE